MSHYDPNYFDWQKKMGEFGGKATLWMFSPFIKKSDKVIDFGSGGGYLLSNIDCSEKLGIEINASGRENAKTLGVDAVGSTAEAPDEWADVVMTNHVLEHTFQPMDELIALRAKLKRGGMLVIVVPNEKHYAYKPEDINQHLYTWSAMALGNLVTHAGYVVIQAEELRYKWPPRFTFWWNLLGPTGFKWLSKLWANYGPWYKPWVSNIRVVAQKP